MQVLSIFKVPPKKVFKIKGSKLDFPAQASSSVTQARASRVVVAEGPGRAVGHTVGAFPLELNWPERRD